MTKYYGRFRRGGPELWKGNPVTMGDARIYSQTVNISAVQNKIIELVLEGNHNRRSLARAMNANYDSLCRHIRLLIEDGVLCEHEKGRLGIAPLDQEVG